MTPGLGRRPAVDVRNFLYPMRTALNAPVSRGIDTVKTWRFLGHPLDQGTTGTCVAHTAAHFIHCAPIGHKGFLDPYDLYREIVLLDEYASNDEEANEQDIQKLQGGSSGTGAARALEKRGLLKEYVWGRKASEVVAWLLTRGPVMFGSNWYSGMFEPNREGYIKPTGTVVGGHQYLFNGVDLRQGLVRGINSWGPAWNPSAKLCRPGHFVMSIEVMERLLKEDGDAVSAVER